MMIATEQVLQACRQVLIERPGREYFPTQGWEVLAEEVLRQVCEALGDEQAVRMIEGNQRAAASLRKADAARMGAAQPQE